MPLFQNSVVSKYLKTQDKSKLSWEEYFTTDAIKVNSVKPQIEITDKAIDTMVYELYRLSNEEIAIVEMN